MVVKPPDRRAIVIAGHTGAVDLARSALSADEPRTRASAVGALHRMQALTTAELGAALRDPSPMVVGRACRIAARTGVDWDAHVGAPTRANGAPDADDQADIDAALVGLVRSGPAELAEVAAWTMGERHQEAPSDDPLAIAAVNALVAATTGHVDPLVREAAVAALGSIGLEMALSAVLQATTDKATVRRRAVIALAAFDVPAATAALERARTDRDWQVRQAAEDLLAD